MGRFWNLRTKLIAVLVLVLSGTFLLQTVIHDHNEQQLLQELEKVAQDIANDTSDLIAQQTETQLARLRNRLGHPIGIALQGIRFTAIMRPEATRRADSRARAPSGVQRTPGRPRFVLVADPTFSAELARQLQLTLEREAAPRPAGLEPGATPEVESDPSTAHPPETATVVSTIAGGPAVRIGSDHDLESGLGLPLPGESAPPVLDITKHVDVVQELFNSSKRHDLLATVGVFLIGIALAWFLGVRVTRPVDEVVHGFQCLAEGDFEARVPERPGEEFGHLGRQFNAMVERLSDGRELERELSQRERIQHMGDLAAGVAHDVRNPLNAIHLNIGQIRDEFVPGDDRGRERFLRFTADVQREVERLNLLVSNFLSLAQPAAREAEAVDPNELVDELFRLLRKEATGRNVELALDLEEGLPSLSWNRQEIKSAFLNIAINALQALGDEGGHLVVSSGLRQGRNGPELLVSFSDDGPGIPPEDLERVFVPYYTTRKGGTGLGMAIARRTAERHCGRVELRSAVGEGTAVAFVFPCPGHEGAA